MALNRRAVSKPSGKLKKTPTQLEFLKRIGLTYHGTETLKPLTQRALKKLISSAADTLASHSPSPENEQARTTPAIFGPICSESFAHYDRRLSYWRTSQDTFPWGLHECSLIFPKAGTMRNGVCYQQPEWEPRISGKDFSLLPTPRANKRWFPDSHGNVQAWGRFLPTPRAADADKNIRTAAGRAKERLRRKNGEDLPTVIDGRPHPEFVEWMLGFPAAWTELDASATPSSRRSLRKSAG